VNPEEAVGRRIVRGLTVATRGAVWLLGALTLLAFLDRFSSYMELLTFFRFQYAVLLVLAAAAAFALRAPRAALAGLVFAGVNMAVVAPTWVSPRVEGAPASGSLELLLLNLEAANDQHADVAHLIDETDPDVIGLIELTPTWADALARALASFPHRQLSPEAGAYGIGLYSRLKLHQPTVARFPREGPASIVARFDLDGIPLTLVITHVHTPFAGDIHRQQFDALVDARERLGEHLAICGDLNAVPWSSSFRHLASTADLRDSDDVRWFEGSWPSWSVFLRVPIDNCLLSDGVGVLEQTHGPEVGSDHFPLTIRFGISGAARAP